MDAFSFGASSSASTKVFGAATAGLLVLAGRYAMATYVTNAYANGTAHSAIYSSSVPATMTRIFGPGETIPGTFTVPMITGYSAAGAAEVANCTFALLGGVVFQNSDL